MHSIKKNDTCELVELPQGKKAIGSKWVYKTKYNVDETIERHKSRLVARASLKDMGLTTRRPLLLWLDKKQLEWFSPLQLTKDGRYTIWMTRLHS